MSNKPLIQIDWCWLAVIVFMICGVIYDKGCEIGDFKVNTSQQCEEKE